MVKNKFFFVIIVLTMFIGYASANIVTEFKEAIKKKHLHEARTLMQEASNVNIADEHGDTMLMVATFANLSDFVRELLERGANPEQENKKQCSALIYALTGSNNEEIREYMSNYITLRQLEQDRMFRQALQGIGEVAPPAMSRTSLTNTEHASAATTCIGGPPPSRQQSGQPPRKGEEEQEEKKAAEIKEQREKIFDALMEAINSENDTQVQTLISDARRLISPDIFEVFVETASYHLQEIENDESATSEVKTSRIKKMKKIKAALEHSDSNSFHLQKVLDKIAKQLSIAQPCPVPPQRENPRAKHIMDELKQAIEQDNVQKVSSLLNQLPSLGLHPCKLLDEESQLNLVTFTANYAQSHHTENSDFIAALVYQANDQPIPGQSNPIKFQPDEIAKFDSLLNFRSMQ